MHRNASPQLVARMVEPFVEMLDATTQDTQPFQQSQKKAADSVVSDWEEVRGVITATHWKRIVMKLLLLSL